MGPNPPVTGGETCTDVDEARRSLARLSCLNECTECLREMKPLPYAVCYVPAEVTYEPTSNDRVIVYSSPSKEATKLTSIPCTTSNALVVSGQEWFTSDGHWGRLMKVLSDGQEVTDSAKATGGWILLSSTDSSQTPYVKATSQPAGQTDERTKSSHLTTWREVVEHEYTVRSGSLCEVMRADSAAVDQLRLIPSGWTMSNYQQLARLLSSLTDRKKEFTNIHDCVSSIRVSSNKASAKNLTDGNIQTFWESSTASNTPWIRLNMKPGVAVRKIVLTVKKDDMPSVPTNVVVKAGSTKATAQEISNEDVSTHSFEGNEKDIVLLDETCYYPVYIIKMRNYFSEMIRIRGIKIVTNIVGAELNVTRDMFDTATEQIQLCQLKHFDTETLYRRSIVIKRLMELVDSVLAFIAPPCELSVTSRQTLEVIRDFMTLSKTRSLMVQQFLQKTETTSSEYDSTIHLSVDRRAAREHCNIPSRDPHYRNSIFSQIYHGLLQSPMSNRITYRWAPKAQWWRCSFIGEEASDHGGLFRESISALSEELCPSNPDDLLPLPFFIRSPNQTNVEATNYRDFYIPSPSCTDFHKFEWIGKLMGACFRATENLIVHLAPFIWKKLCGHKVTWSDFVSVDEAEVLNLERMEKLDEAVFNSYGDELMWTTTLSDGTVVQLKPSMDTHVTYDDRVEYAQLVMEARMNESKLQIEAIQRGLMQTIPRSILDLITWQELEMRVCGDPEIALDDLRKSATLTINEQQQKFFWEVMEKFSNMDRSRFLRFVSGRRRLPVKIFVTSGYTTSDGYPTASTCGYTIVMPEYTSAAMMEKQLRYAIYNCFDMDLA